MAIDLTALDTDPLLVIEGDCVAVMASLPENSVDSICTDPPYGLEFMGKEWDRLVAPTGGARFTTDGMGKGFKALPSFRGSPNPTCRICGGTKRGNDRVGFTRCRCEVPDFPDTAGNQSRAMQVWHEAWAREALRVLKPGGYLLSFGGTRTYHRMTCAIEDAGFEIRDCIAWHYGSGFPKSLNVGKALDAKALTGRSNSVALSESEKTRPVVGQVRRVVSKDRVASSGETNHGVPANMERWHNYEQADIDVTAPSTDLAKQWQGWGTALKPAFEPVVVARKPLQGTVAANVERHGTGALNIDASRVQFAGPADLAESTEKNRHADFGTKPGGNKVYGDYTMVPRKNYQPGGTRDGEASAERRYTEEGGTDFAMKPGRRIRAPQSDPRKRKGVVGTDLGISNADVETFQQAQRDSIERMETLGRWPANVLLSHDERCVEVGTKRVKGNPVLAGDPKQYAGGTFAGGLSGHIKYTDADGMETVSAWDCVPDCPVRLLDEQSGERPGGNYPEQRGQPVVTGFGQDSPPTAGGTRAMGDTGGASRFFTTLGREPLPIEGGDVTRFMYTAKADKQDRAGSLHPTVKPVDLMKWLVTLVTPPGGIVLDPFAGSGTTGVAALQGGFRCVLIEKDHDYYEAILKLRSSIQVGLGL